MAVNVLRNGVNHHISTVIQWILNVRAHEGIINHNQNAMAVRNRGNFANINQRQGRV
jgi:hypothetical protein